MNYLILGAGGFLGKQSCRYFHDKLHTVTGISRNRNLVDLTNQSDCEQLFKNRKVDVLLQFAASTTNSKDVVEKPWVHVTDNAVMNSYIFKYAVEHKVKHVIFPSCTTMYPGDLGRPVKEEDFDRDRIYSKYFGVASTKVYIEDMCKFWSQQGDTKFTVIRHSNIYGPGDRFDQATAHVCGATIKKVLDSGPNRDIAVWGDGTEVRDLLYIDDLMDAISVITEKQTDKYALFNVGSGVPITVTNLTKEVMKVAKKETSKVVFNGTAPTLKFSLVLDSSKLNTLGWKPKTSLSVGLGRTIDWYKKNGKV